MASEWSGRVAVFDVESSGISVENDRIIQAFVGLMDSSGEWLEEFEVLINPGVEIPEGAAAVHGYSTERIRAEGNPDWSRCIQDIEGAIVGCTSNSTPLVMFNGSFDMSMLTWEMRRAGYKWDIWDFLKSSGVPIIDPFVIDKHKDKYRRGSRKLVDVAPVYGVQVEKNAHDAGADCLMTGRIAIKQLSGYRGSISELTEKQAEWACEQRQSLQDYFKKSGKKNDDGTEIHIDTGWPIYNSVKEKGN